MNTPAIIIIIIVILLCLMPWGWLLWLGYCDDKRYARVRREMAAWDAERAQHRIARAVEDRKIISPATFPATQQERRDLEEALPGYKFVSPVSDKEFRLAAKRIRTKSAERGALHAYMADGRRRDEDARATVAAALSPTLQTISDIVADAESRN